MNESFEGLSVWKKVLVDEAEKVVEPPMVSPAGSQSLRSLPDMVQQLICVDQIQGVEN